MYNKNEIIEAIEINNAAISKHSAKLKKMNKILSMIAEFEEEFDTFLINPVDIHNKVDETENEISWHKEQLKKRQKQLKLLEQFEALDEE